MSNGTYGESSISVPHDPPVPSEWRVACSAPPAEVKVMFERLAWSSFAIALLVVGCDSQRKEECHRRYVAQLDSGCGGIPNHKVAATGPNYALEVAALRQQIGACVVPYLRCQREIKTPALKAVCDAYVDFYQEAASIVDPRNRHFEDDLRERDAKAHVLSDRLSQACS
jgi:hypothetical protein